MSDNYLTERLRLRDFLIARGVSYNQKDKTWRCYGHDDDHESAVLYDNPNGGILHCPVCRAANSTCNWDIFALVELYDHITDFKEKLRIVRQTLNIPNPQRGRKKRVPLVSLPLDDARKVYTEAKIDKIAADKGWGARVGRWPYHDKDGNIIGVDVRFEAPGQKKNIITFWYDGTDLRWADPPVLIYNLQEALTNDRRILIHEGAKCADTAKIIPDFTHISWSGGSGKAQLADWSPLCNREVYILPDDDEPGLNAAHKIAGKIKARIIRPIESVRAQKPKGADIIEILQVMTPDEFTAYALDPANHLSVSESCPDTPDHLPQSPQSLPQNTDPSGHLSQPFKILGIGDDGKAAFITKEGRLVKWSLDSLSKNKLMVLAGRGYWHCQYPNKNSADYDTAIDDIIRLAQCQDFHESDIRGRGAWRDGDKISYHDGITTHGDYDKKKIYLRLPHKDIGISDTGAGMELTRAIKDTVMKLSFETPADAVRCLGWSVLSPFAGALPFRPAMLMTGPSSSGKTTVANLIIRKLAACEWFNGSESTVAGVRGRIKNDSTGIMFEEVERDTQKKATNREELFSLMRVNVSDDAPDTVKGTKEGGYNSFKMQNMFGFIAIDPTIESVADENRIFRVNMVLPQNQDDWKEIETKLKNLLSESNCRSIRALTWQKLKVIFTLSDRIVDAIRQKTGRDYRSSFADALLASAFMVIWAATDAPTDEQIDGMLNRYYSFQPAEEHRDEAAELVERILDETIEIIRASGREKQTIRECLNKVYSEIEGVDDYRLTLARLGIRLVDVANVAIANRHHMIMKLIETGNGYNKIFKRHPGYIEGQRTCHFPDGKARRCTVIKGLITKKYEDKDESEKLEGVMFD